MAIGTGRDCWVSTGVPQIRFPGITKLSDVFGPSQPCADDTGIRHAGDRQEPKSWRPEAFAGLRREEASPAASVPTPRRLRGSTASLWVRVPCPASHLPFRVAIGHRLALGGSQSIWWHSTA